MKKRYCSPCGGSLILFKSVANSPSQETRTYIQRAKTAYKDLSHLSSLSLCHTQKVSQDTVIWCLSLARQFFGVILLKPEVKLARNDSEHHSGMFILKRPYYALWQSIYFVFGLYYNMFSYLNVQKPYFSHFLHYCIGCITHRSIYTWQ